MASAALLLLIAGISYYIYREAQRYYSLKAFGGHWTAGWTRLWLLRAHSSGRMNLYFTEANDKYGMLNALRLAPPSPYIIYLVLLELKIPTMDDHSSTRQT